MKNEILIDSLTDKAEVKEYEAVISIAELEHQLQQLSTLMQHSDTTLELDSELCKMVSKYLGQPVHQEDLASIKLPWGVWLQLLDDTYGIKGALIQPSHQLKQFSIIRKKPELQDYIPAQGSTRLVDILNDRSTCRASEILNEFTSDNTRMAHYGDLVYWQAWLTTIGFSGQEPITSQEVLTFIVQHAEGLDHDIDAKLVNQGYKAKLGPHKLATIKRRVGSLSVFLESVKWENPCRDPEISLLFQKLTKKYGSSKPAGKAITKDILLDMVETCNERNKLIDTRDKALLLFAWCSGGRRRSEVTAASVKDLCMTPECDFVYTLPESKTDQTGKGHPVPIKGRAALALNDWLTAANITEGAVFRAIDQGGTVGQALSPCDVNRIVRKRLKKAGYDETQFTAHSLRSGFVTQAGKQGKPLGDVMAMTTHKSVATAMRYYQAGAIINNSAADLFD
ncbi:MAG: site-specific integrase [Candidatus Babeliales bacterium]